MKKLIFSIVVAAAMLSSYVAYAGDADLAYFKQFLYKVDEDLSDPDFPEYTYYHLGTYWNFRVPMPDNKYMNPQTTIYMFEDGTYEIRYKETFWTNQDIYLPGSKCETFTGTWAVPDKTLILYKDGKVLAEGIRSTWEQQHAVTFTFKQAIINPALNGKTVQATIVQSNVGKDGPQMPCF